MKKREEEQEAGRGGREGEGYWSCDTCMMGAWSSPEAVAICVAMSGCQAMALHRMCEVESATWMMGSFFLKSQTTERPPGSVEARMCCTCVCVCVCVCVCI